MIDGKNIIQTLMELLESQEQIKISYTLKKYDDE